MKNILSLQESWDETETWWNQEEIWWAVTCSNILCFTVVTFLSFIRRPLIWKVIKYIYIYSSKSSSPRPDYCQNCWIKKLLKDKLFDRVKHLKDLKAIWTSGLGWQYTSKSTTELLQKKTKLSPLRRETLIASYRKHLIAVVAAQDGTTQDVNKFRWQLFFHIGLGYIICLINCICIHKTYV